MNEFSRFNVKLKSTL